MTATRFPYARSRSHTLRAVCLRRTVSLLGAAVCLAFSLVVVPLAAYAQGEKADHPANLNAVTVPFGRPLVDWEKELPSELTKEFEDAVAAGFTGPAGENVFSEGIRRALGVLIGAGYRRAQVKPHGFVLNDARLDFSLTVDPGPVYRVLGCEYTGLSQTDTLWLNKVLDLPFGLPLTTAWLSDAARKLEGVSYLRITAAPEIIPVVPSGSTGDTDVLVRWHLQEAQSTRFDGLLASGGESAREGLKGRMDVRFGGLFGRDRSMNLRYERLRPDRTTINLRFAEHGAFGRPIDWMLAIDEQRQVENRQSLSARAGYLAGRWRIGIRGGWTKITPGTVQTTPARMTEATVSLQRVGIINKLRYGTTRGLNVSVKATLSRRRAFGLTSDADNARVRLEGDALLIRPLAAGWVVQVSTLARWWPAGENQLGAGDEWYLGGVDRLRGYEDQSIVAASGLWSAVEIQRRLAPSMVVSLFGEGARIRSIGAWGARGNTMFPFGYGWALGLQSRDRVGRLEFAWRDGASWRDGIVRLRVSQSW